jgi:zinc/manganese transport system substrate-binding protein
MHRRLTAAVSAMASVALIVTLVGCAQADDGAGQALSIVASTNVYADIARQVAGIGVEVTAIIDSAAKDPHEYEASAQDQLAVSKADLLIGNGGGYDAFFEILISASGNVGAPVLTAVDIPGGTAVDIPGGEVGSAAGQLNEHVWYDFGRMQNLAGEIAARLSELDPAGADGYQANAAQFGAAIADLVVQRTELAGHVDGMSVAVTEALPLYLLDALGLVNLTPAEFSAAIEEGIDAPAAAMRMMLALLSERSVDGLVVNAQTAGAQTDALMSEAERNGIPVIAMTETLPDGRDYQTWMAANLLGICTALEQ